MVWNWVPVLSVCGSCPCAFTYCQTCIYFRLYDCHGDWGSLERERELMTQWFYTLSLDREFARSCELWVVSALLVLLKAGFILHLLILAFKRISYWGRDWLYSWQTWSVKSKAVPYNLPSHTQDPCSQNSICSSCREQTTLSLHSTLGKGRIYG